MSKSFLTRPQARKVEDFLLPLKPSIEKGELSVSDLIRLVNEKLSITTSLANIESCLESVSIERPRATRTGGGIQPLLTRIANLEDRVAALEEATTRPFPKAQPLPHPQR